MIETSVSQSIAERIEQELDRLRRFADAARPALAAAPKQDDEGAPPARVVFRPEFREAARGLREAARGARADVVAPRAPRRALRAPAR